MERNEELIVLKKSSLKQFIGKFFKLIIKSYLALNKETTVFWRRLFSSEWRIRKLLESDAVVLLFNTILFCFIATVLRGLIANILLIVAFLNVLAFLLIKLEWVDKLLKK